MEFCIILYYLCNFFISSYIFYYNIVLFIAAINPFLKLCDQHIQSCETKFLVGYTPLARYPAQLVG